MITATAVVVPDGDREVQSIAESWPYFSTPKEPLRLDVPALSTIERLIMESTADPKERMGYELPVSDMGEDPFEAFPGVCALPARPPASFCHAFNVGSQGDAGLPKHLLAPRRAFGRICRDS
jgi:hypothetical protein